MVISQYLQNNGYQVFEAKDGPEAIKTECPHEGGFDLLITDVVMPEMDGYVLARTLCSRYARMKVLFLSGYPEKARTGSQGDTTETAYLQKPCTARQLISAVRQLLEPGE